MGGVKTERVFPGLSVLRKNKKMEVLYPENYKKVKLGQRERSPVISVRFSRFSTSKIKNGSTVP
jgi:hypothetical protein